RSIRSPNTGVLASVFWPLSTANPADAMRAIGARDFAARYSPCDKSDTDQKFLLNRASRHWTRTYCNSLMPNKAQVMIDRATSSQSTAGTIKVPNSLFNMMSPFQSCLIDVVSIQRRKVKLMDW